MQSLKPHNTAFNYFIRNTSLNRNNKIVFFEDTIDNLVTAKNDYNWITVLISPTNLRKNNYIDYIYKDIHTAVENFSFNPGKCYALI